ncbi:MAG: FAD-dependent oxidoreductase [Lachnospiraceae bacterium]|nr:FAD-dependent oxidoreductase [Lachnospiraceae bacterium]
MKKLIVSNIKLDITDSEEKLPEALAKRKIICEPEDILIVRKALDARDKDNIHYVYTVALDPAKSGRIRKGSGLSLADIKPYSLPESGSSGVSGRHVVIGSGPAGMFAGLILAKAGYRPLIIERGQPVGQRQKTVEHFWAAGSLDPESNACFGEGGAGTFSDGKLNTGIKDPDGRIRFILETFARFGADRSVTYSNKPHVGSDVLAKVVAGIREEIIRLGGEYLFRTKLTAIIPGKSLTLQLESEGSSSNIEAESVILATGHSAHDIYHMLSGLGAQMTQKPFTAGFRIEHLQSDINLAQYGERYAGMLPAADYKLSHKSITGKGVYTFCMCPGGYVVDTSTDSEGICINGMSFSARNGRNANSAVIAVVDESDFGSDDIFAGLRYQKAIEKAARRAGGGVIPVQRLSDYLSGKPTPDFGKVLPDIKGSFRAGSVSGIFSDLINASIADGIKAFGQKIKCFDDEDAVLSGVESRTSSPVKILRGDNFESNISGIFPCGEGAGYAGGITSAAADGMKVAEEIIRRYRPC